MIIPEHLKWEGMTADDLKRVKQQVEKKRKIMRGLPTHATVQEATDAAVKMAKTVEYSNPSVWKEPLDIGKKYAAVHIKDRENAGVSGYTEVVDMQQIADKAKDIDEIEEV